MGDQIYVLKDGENIPVEPVGTFITAGGWMPGEWAVWSTTARTFSQAFGTVDRSDGTGILAGFLITGPQHLQPVELQSDMWTTDTRQRAGGDTHADWTSQDASSRALQLDSELLLQRLGTRIATMFIPPTGYHKVYVFETSNLAERTTPGSGAALTYSSGDKLYVSARGRFTSEQESSFHVWTGYVVARYDNDDEGNFIIAVAAMA